VQHVGRDNGSTGALGHFLLLFFFGTFNFDFKFPIFPSHLNNLNIILKAEVSQIEDKMRELQQEINSTNLSVTRSLFHPYYLCVTTFCYWFWMLPLCYLG
jgi:hypothetical protein